MSQFYIGGGTSSTPVVDNYMVLVEQATVSGQADVQFITGITSTYDDYYLKFYGVTSTAPSTLYLQFSIDGGANWIATNYDTNTVFCQSVSQSGVYQGLLPGMLLSGNLTSTANAQSAGYANLYRLTSNTFMPGMIALSKCTGNIFDGETNYGCNYTGAMVVNGIRIVPDAGVLSGTFKLYGIVQ